MRLPNPTRAALAAALCLPTALVAQTPPVTKDAPAASATPAFKPDLLKGAERGAFLVRIGSDTIGVERFARTKDRVEGEGVSRVPSAMRRNYFVTYGPDGAPRSFVVHTERVDKGAPPTHADVTFGADSVRVNMSVNGQPRAMAMPATATALPQIGPGGSVALLEAATMRLVSTRADSLAVPMIFPGAPQPITVTVRRVGSDSADFVFPGPPVTTYHARIDKSGRVLGLQGLETTQKIVVERVKDTDAALLVGSLAQREGVGVLSPADSAIATLGTGTVKITYSQPALRGRTAVGGLLVPYGQVWRTGANFATALTTDVDLDIGGTTVPAGKYTLWTLPTAEGWQLIVNRKILDERGQPLWGTMYDAKEDLARIPMTVSRSAEKVERFKITMEGGQLRMAWENTVATVAVTPKA